MDEALRRRMIYRYLYAIFVQINEIKIIVDQNRQASKFIWATKTAIIAGLAGLAGSIMTNFGAVIVKLFTK
jgi:hypothetical protein